MSVVEVKTIGNLMIGSTVEVSSDSYQEGQMEDLSRESVWGNEEEESKFWF